MEDAGKEEQDVNEKDDVCPEEDPGDGSPRHNVVLPSAAESRTPSQLSQLT